MKTRILNILLLMVVAMGFAACEDDKDPILNKVSDGTLDEALLLTMESDAVLDRANADNNALRLAWTLPEYDVQLAQGVEVQASLTDDFADTRQAAVVTGPDHAYLTVGGLNGMINEMAANTADIIVDGDTPVTVYFRAIFGLNEDAERDVISNTVSCTVTPYAAESVLYLIGSPSGWDINNGAMTVNSSDGTIYTGNFTLEAGAMFRFYSKLGDWDSNSYGSQAEDNPVNITADFVDGVYEGPVVAGKGSWQIDNAGDYTITVNLQAMTIRIEPAILPSIYLVGSPQNWNISGDDMPLTCATGDDVYVGVFDLPAGAQFRFYSELGDWDTGSLGSQVDDAGIEITIPYDGELVAGKGTWIIPDAGVYTLTVDVANMTVSFVAGGEISGGGDNDGDGEEPEIPTGLFVIGNINNWSTDADGGTAALTDNGGGVWSGTFDFPADPNGDGTTSYFRFCTTLDGTWSAANMVGTVDGGDEVIDITSGYAEVSVAQGNEGAFVITPGTYSITVDLNSNLLVVETAE